MQRKLLIGVWSYSKKIIGWSLLHTKCQLIALTSLYIKCSPARPLKNRVISENLAIPSQFCQWAFTSSQRLLLIRPDGGACRISPDNRLLLNFVGGDFGLQLVFRALVLVNVWSWSLVTYIYEYLAGIVKYAFTYVPWDVAVLCFVSFTHNIEIDCFLSQKTLMKRLDSNSKNFH